MRTLYPASEPRRAQWLAVGDGHAVYVEEGGSPEGLPVVFLHGGPGGGCKPSHRQFFEPRYRSFLIDQRGAGRSTPFGATDANTTQALIADLETLRQWAEVERWVLFGGSWGGALALAYAETHPERVLGMVLRGTFLARQRDLEWFMAAGAARLLPQAWHEFLTATQDFGHDIPALHAAMFGPDLERARRAVQAWSRWSTSVVMYGFESAPQEPASSDTGPDTEPDAELFGKMRIELHYAHAQYFLRANQLLEDIGRVPRVPIHLIHGQRDITCAPEAAWAVHQALPWSTIEILRAAGHLSAEAAIQDALVRAADAMVLELVPKSS